MSSSEASSSVSPDKSLYTSTKPTLGGIYPFLGGSSDTKMTLNQGMGSFFDTTNAVTAATNLLSSSDLQPHAKSLANSIEDLMCDEISCFKIIDSTLREGEQFANSWFTTEKKIEIARALDDFGVDYIELTSLSASDQSRQDCKAICKLGLKAKVLTHIRCHMNDARIAVETGVDGVNIVMGTSSYLQKHSHGKNMAYIRRAAIEVIQFVKGIEVRFSSEGSFRSGIEDILPLYSAVDSVGVHRVGIADTVGGASPLQVYNLVKTVREAVGCDIETHFHNDTGCAVANAYTALEAGATHIDTTILGIGERNGITSLGSLMAHLSTTNVAMYVQGRYRLEKLPKIENMVAQSVKADIPFNNCSITSLNTSLTKVKGEGLHLSEVKPQDSDSCVVIYPQDAALAPGKKRLRLDILLGQKRGELLRYYRKRFREGTELNLRGTTL